MIHNMGDNMENTNEFRHCSHSIVRQGRTEECRSSFGPGTSKEVSESLDAHCAQWHPDTVCEWIATCADIVTGERITEANGYATARQMISDLTTMETDARTYDRNGSHRELLASIGSFLAEVRRMTREYEDLDPVKLFNDQTASAR
jgi:hypothetical protein